MLFCLSVDQLLKSPVMVTVFFPGAYKLKIADLPPLIKVTPSFAPAGTSFAVGFGVGSGTFPEPPPEEGFLLHEVTPISRMPISNKYKFLIFISSFCYNWCIKVGKLFGLVVVVVEVVVVFNFFLVVFLCVVFCLRIFIFTKIMFPIFLTTKILTTTTTKINWHASSPSQA